LNNRKEREKRRRGERLGEKKRERKGSQATKGKNFKKEEGERK
jgi:hypothetical protein